MAKRKHRRTWPASGRKTGSQSTYRDRLLQIGVGIMVLGLLAFGAFQFIEPVPNQGAGPAAAIAADNQALEATSLEDGRNLEPVDVAPVTDRETRYLGPTVDALPWPRPKRANSASQPWSGSTPIGDRFASG